MSIFDKYLSIWVALSIAIGVAVGKWLPIVPQTLDKWEYANVSLPVAALIAMMIYPMMLKIDFSSVCNLGYRSGRARGGAGHAHACPHCQQHALTLS